MKNGSTWTRLTKTLDWVMSTVGRTVNEPNFVELCMFQLGLSRQVKSSNLAWARDKPKNHVWAWARDKSKNHVWAWARGKVKKLGLDLAWLISQVKFKLNIKFKLKLRLSFWAWNLRKLYYQMLKSLKLRRKKKIVYPFDHMSGSTYD